MKQTWFRMKEQCRYGSSCYRKRPEHFLEYEHPSDHPIANMFAKKRKTKNETQDEEPNMKRKKGTISSTDISNNSIQTSSSTQANANVSNFQSATNANPFGLFVTKVQGVSQNDIHQASIHL